MRKVANYLSVVTVGAVLVLGVPAQANQELATKHACLACHQIETKVVGPAYKEVANKYKGMGEEKVKELVHKVMVGGSGVWGPVPMPPNVNVSEADATTLVKWVLSLADGAAAPGAEAPAAAAPAAPAEGAAK